MAEAPTRDNLVERVVSLAGLPAARLDAARRSYGRLATSDLEKIVERLERASKAAPAPAERDELSAPLAAAFARRDAALDRLDVASLALRSAAKARDVSPEDAQAVAEATTARAQRLRRSAAGDAPRLEPSFAYWSRLNDVLLSGDLQPMESVLVERMERALKLMSVDAGAALSGYTASSPDPVFETYARVLIENMGRDALRLLGRRPNVIAGDRTAKTFWRHDLALRTSLFDPMLLVDEKPVLPPSRAAEGLAKLYLYARDFGAQRIVTFDGNANVAGFLRTEMGLAPSRWHLVPKSRPADPRGLMAMAARPGERVLVVVDVASPAVRLAELRSVLATSAADVQVSIVAMGGRVALRDELETDGAVYFPHLTVDRELTLPWSIGGAYRRKRATHLFGESARSPFEIARSFMVSVTQSLSTVIAAVAR